MPTADSTQAHADVRRKNTVPAPPPRQNSQSRHREESKSLARAVLQAPVRDVDQLSIGRIQRKNGLIYCLVIQDAKTRQVVNKPRPQPVAQRVLERYQGFVLKIEETWAHVVLTTESGEELAGTYPVDELVAQGIGERDRFLLSTMKHGTDVRFVLSLVPRWEVSPAEQRDIHDSIARELGGYTPGDDY